MNRADFVIRQLRYYASVKCPHTIYIGDSSDKEDSEKIQNEVKRLGSSIKAKYYSLPSYNIWQAHYYLLTQVEEKYTCLSGDDDYQIPDSVTECAKFLENNPEYTTASGHAVSFRLNPHGVYGKLLRLADYHRGQIENGSAADRIVEYFNSYFVTFFSVNRTEQTKRCWKSSEKIPDQAFGAEILPSSLQIVNGKSKIIDCLGFIRQIHGQQNGLVNTFEWITKPIWLESYEKFEKIISDAMVERGGISYAEAREATRLGFWSYLQTWLAKDYRSTLSSKGLDKTKDSKIKVLKSTLKKKLPLIGKVYSAIKPFISDKKYLHYEVLQNSSKYYKDFKPVMDSFTGQIRNT
ncbi:MAG: TIGR00180 family glycosyltransferase [Candidatus Yanofskybacteria bacterium]|nr:TIGR00180 family glycosyltransferase [Candidatus Yanofskybacteria bacterium]